MAKNIADFFFGEKKQDKTKCKNILVFDFVNEKASNISPEKIRVMKKKINKDQ